MRVLWCIVLLALTAPLAPAQAGKALTMPENKAFLDLCFSPDASKIAVRQGAEKLEDDIVRVYSLPGLKLLGAVGRCVHARGTKFSPDGAFLAVIEYHDKQDKICVYDVTESPPRLVNRLVFKNRTGAYRPWPRQMMFSPDGKHLFATQEVGEKSLLHGWEFATSDRKSTRLNSSH